MHVVDDFYERGREMNLIFCVDDHLNSGGLHPSRFYISWTGLGCVLTIRSWNCGGDSEEDIDRVPLCRRPGVRAELS